MDALFALYFTLQSDSWQRKRLVDFFFDSVDEEELKPAV